MVKYICLLGSDRTLQQNQSFERFKRLIHKDGNLGKILDTLGALVTFHCRSFPSRVDACAESHASKNGGRGRLANWSC